jgi:hypothetical protein
LQESYALLEERMTVVGFGDCGLEMLSEKSFMSHVLTHYGGIILMMGMNRWLTK